MTSNWLVLAACTQPWYSVCYVPKGPVCGEEEGKGGGRG